MTKVIGWTVLIAGLAMMAACSGPATEGGSAPAQEAMPTRAAMPTAPMPPPATMPPPAPVRSLTLGSSIWRWARLVNGAGTETNNVSPDRYTIQFRPAEGQVSIRSDCQSATGTFSSDERTLAITLIAMTNAMCAPDSQADLFIGLVSQAESYSFEGDTLVFKLRGDGGNLYLSP
jgi:heat shock protein HslJ